ncbi:MATE family efflux transporter [Haloimpatiens lingqiaonensis]|uniref:MATE family efflux transporter n=1 Tax=Haloimpatiens lingqiaonensis TaxID=1380675 RepID=UPI0010FF02A0|nr:MATE family efflux transporter [Haloimpatiens lingqiaonensis]
MDKSKQLGTESIGKLLVKFSIPAIIGMLVNALYSIVDRAYIGHIDKIGTDALSGLTSTMPISTTIMAFGMLVGIGTSALISIKLGEKKKEEAERILGNAVFLDGLISLIIGILGIIFLDKLLILFGAGKESIPYAKTYITIILLGAPLQNIGFGINNSIRAEGNPKMAMLTMIFGALINIILDPIFIFLFGMGIKGAAIATVISETFNTIWVMYYFTSKRSGSILKVKKENLKLDLKIVKSIFAIGMSPFAMQIAASVVVVLYNRGLYTYGGNKAVAAMGIINSISMLIFMPMFGINQGVQPIIGYNYGAKNYKRVKRALKLAILAATIIATLGFLCVQIFPKTLISLFTTKDIELLNIGTRGLRIDLIFLPIIGMQIVGSNYFQAIGQAKTAMLLSLLRQVVILIPLILILPNLFKLDGLWMSQPCADVISFILTAIFLFRSIKELK